jgi:DNA-binding NarL/FixJ family response regulator
VIVDISLNGTDGIQLTKRIKTEKPHLPVLILTMHEEGLLAKNALAAGAEGYVTKQENVEIILSAIRLSLIGKQYVSERVKEKLKKIGPNEG